VRRAGPILIAVIGLLALAVDFLPNLTIPDLKGDTAGRGRERKLGLDWGGGRWVEYRVDCRDAKCPSLSDVNVVKGIIERRVNATGVSEPQVVTAGTDRIVVEVPGVSNTAAIRKLVGQTGALYFVPIPAGSATIQTGQVLDLTKYTPLFGGEQVKGANPGVDKNGGRAVNFTLQSDGASAFAAYTAAHINEQFAIVLDGTVISAPVIQSAVTGGSVEITNESVIGGLPSAEVDNIVNVLRFGSLPFPVEELASDTIDPTLGAEFLTRSLFAGAIAIGLVILFMLLHYRLPGAVASFALIYYSLVVLAVFRLIPVVLTLAGIAGFVLSIGMAVDANILIFERTKEELRLGKSLPQAIEAGFNRAWNSILDSNVSSLITASILYFFGSSVIQGFALVLIIGVLVSMFSAITVTRTFLRLVVRNDWARKAWLYGVSDTEFTARPAGRRTLRGEARGV
jgi:preprotein translocase subunit SecD